MNRLSVSQKDEGALVRGLMLGETFPNQGWIDYQLLDLVFVTIQLRHHEDMVVRCEVIGRCLPVEGQVASTIRLRVLSVDRNVLANLLREIS